MVPPAKALPQTETLQIETGLPGRDSLSLTLTHVAGAILECKLGAIGCMEMLELVALWRPRLKGDLKSLPVPEGNSHSEILLRELILKAKGEWKYPIEAERLCQCRAVSTAKVDRAIVGGCHTLEAVRRATSASTSCGTCRPEVEDLLAFRLRCK